jgi:CxxC motif-containing protein
MLKEITCTVCPIGCNIFIESEKNNIISVKGYGCSRGIEYGKNEFLYPVRILTTTVKAAEDNILIPVRSSKPIPKEMLMECMSEIKKIRVTGNVKQYDIIISNICGSDADMVATRSYEKNSFY